MRPPMLDKIVLDEAGKTGQGGQCWRRPSRMRLSWIRPPKIDKVIRGEATNTGRGRQCWTRSSLRRPPMLDEAANAGRGHPYSFSFTFNKMLNLFDRGRCLSDSNFCR